MNYQDLNDLTRKFINSKGEVTKTVGDSIRTVRLIIEAFKPRSTKEHKRLQEALSEIKRIRRHVEKMKHDIDFLEQTIREGSDD